VNRNKAIIAASWIGIGVNLALALAKIIGGYFWNSMAVIGDGIDSATDVATYFITFIAARIMMRPPDPKFPYGYNRVEAIATKLLSFFIFFIGAQLVYHSSLNLYFEKPTGIPTRGAVFITLISVVVKLALSWWQMREGKRIQSKMIIANAKNMRNDIVLSLSVLIGVALSLYFQAFWIDQALALLVGFWILKVAFDIFRETSGELMDMVHNTKVYDLIFEAVDSVYGVHNPHRVRVRRLSNLLMIDIDIEVDPDLPMKKVHELGQEVELAIKNKVENVYDIMVHFEPLGNVESEEKFGVSLRPLNEP
jgi:cation diffusion facilitator family transporter